MHPFLTIADRATRLAGKQIIQSSLKRDRLKVYEKKDSQGRVTELDLSVERLLIEHIHAAYPKHSILAEENGLLQREEDYLWVIDPLDGTTNFIHGLPGFSISIAVKKQGELYQALVYDPLAQETFYAGRGEGAKLLQRRLRVSSHREIKNALLYMNRPPSDIDSWCNTVKALAKHSASIRLLGSAALGLAYVAAGRLDGFLSFSSLQPWDTAAGELLVKEAGGVICSLKNNDQSLGTARLIAANPPLIHQLNQLVASLS